jgi:putative DNA primase/helicase
MTEKNEKQNINFSGADMQQDTGTSPAYLPVPICNYEEACASERLPETLEVKSLAGGSKYLIRNTTHNSGVFHLAPDKNGGYNPIFLCSLLCVIALFRDVKNAGWGRMLKFNDMDGHSHEYVLNASSVSKDEAALISILRDQGLTVTTQKLLHFRLIDYLLNTEPLTDRKIRSIRKTGWYTRSLFVTQLECFGKSDEEIVYDGKATHHSFAVSGTLKEWQENIGRYCVGNPILTFVTSMAFAAPLLSPLEIENGGFNLMGESSIGKSTALKVATSVFGRPEKGHAIQQWNATVNFMEGIANAYNDILLPLDEIGQATGNEIGNTIYMLGNGMGKGRMSPTTEIRNRQTFRTLFISSGEKTLEAHMEESKKSVRAGQEVRLVDIMADMGTGYGIYCNIHDQNNSHDFNEALLGSLLQYYGSPMAAYLHKLVDLPDQAIARINVLIADFIKDAVPGDASGQVKRIAGRFALVACGGELATSLGITGWEQGTAYNDARILFERWLSERGNTGQSEELKLIVQVRKFFELHGESRFAVIGVGDTRTVINRVGFREMETIHTQNPEIGECQYTYSVMSEGFKEICSGFNHKRASKTLLAHGILKPNSEGTAMHSKRLPGFSKPKKVYIFTPRIIEDFEETGNQRNFDSHAGTADTQVQTA